MQISLITYTTVALLLLFVTTVMGAEGESVAAIMNKLELYSQQSASGFFVLFTIAMATLVSEDLASIAAGLLAAKSIITPTEAVIASGIGIYLGDIALYLAGYLLGVSALHRAPLKWFLSEQTVKQCKKLYEKRGTAIIVSSRFLPGTRTATFFAAGLVKMNPAKLLTVFGVSVILWTPILVLGSMVAGDIVIRYAELYTRYALWILLGCVAFIFFLSRVLGPLFTWKGRRLWLSRWYRIRYWEFWSPWILYTPLFFYILYLGLIKYRALTLFTLTNPGIEPDSGFLWESKASILSSLLPKNVGSWAILGSQSSDTETVMQLESFMLRSNLTYPIVLKPDCGQRGKGVTICKSEEEAKKVLADTTQKYIAQEYLAGKEYGVFYYRYPGESQGKIFSITKKIPLAVTGNGKNTLEELILSDRRAICMAPLFLKQHQHDLLKVIPDKKNIQLVSLGTHSRGSVFLDGNSLASSDLSKALDKIVQPFSEFYFGRFDLKAASDDCLKRGCNLKVIELNGITSEAVHIYDPKNSVLCGWQTLMKQWELAFAIAAINQKKGHTPMGLRPFLTHLFRGKE